MTAQSLRTLAARVSVVIPVFDRPHDVVSAVASAASQDPPPGEIIVVDDGSAHPPASDAFVGSAVPVVLIRQSENQGAAAARSRGIEAARGDWIAFLDSDDAWLPGKLQAQLPLVKESAETLAAVTCCWCVEDARGRPSGTREPRPGNCPSDFVSGCWFAPGATTIVPRRAFETLGLFSADLRRLEDYEWFVRFGLAGGRLDVARFVGAKVKAGRRAHSEAVTAAQHRILERYRHRLDAGDRRRMRAYLALERAAAYRTEGNCSGLAIWLALSLVLAPRLRIPLQSWWRDVDGQAQRTGGTGFPRSERSRRKAG